MNKNNSYHHIPTPELKNIQIICLIQYYYYYLRVVHSWAHATNYLCSLNFDFFTLVYWFCFLGPNLCFDIFFSKNFPNTKSFRFWFLHLFIDLVLYISVAMNSYSGIWPSVCMIFLPFPTSVLYHFKSLECSIDLDFCFDRNLNVPLPDIGQKHLKEKTPI